MEMAKSSVENALVRVDCLTSIIGPRLTKDVEEALTKLMNELNWMKSFLAAGKRRNSGQVVAADVYIAVTLLGDQVEARLGGVGGVVKITTQDLVDLGNGFASLRQQMRAGGSSSSLLV
ncbi:unnamed protein product [Cuscuta epithymum]|uniref:Uncharacterized protein n=1 Tax=Cuscuta epithymum TaxID=186058 RepID=A0AAV0F8S1_9ASTE|nr:unnamed protein product [Cuscuta epithymum]